MNEKKKAWVYTRIDAPEDRYGSLKRQDQKLTEYASRMGWRWSVIPRTPVPAGI